MKFHILIAASLLCVACSRQSTPPTQSASPSAQPSVAATASTTESSTPVPLGDPALPSDADSYLVALPAWTLEDQGRYPWWTASGISDNGLRAFVSELEPAEAESRLLAFLEQDTRKPLPDTAGFFDVADSRLALYSKEGDSYGVAALVSPPGQPPQAWTALGLPPQDWASNQALLSGKKSVVVIFAGYGTTDYLKNQASGVATPATSESLTPGETASPEL